MKQLNHLAKSSSLFINFGMLISTKMTLNPATIDILVSKLAIGLKKKYVSSDSCSAIIPPSILCRV